MGLRDLLRSRLALRIYLVGLAQIAVVAAGFSAIIEANRPPGPGPLGGHTRYVAGTIEAALADPQALGRELTRASKDLRAMLTVVRPDGSIVATTAGPQALRCSLADRERHVEDAEQVCVAMPLGFPDGGIGHLELIVQPRPHPSLGPQVIAFVLFIVGVSSWLLARSLTGPLRTLSSAARAFGKGDIAARAALKRSDELGEVSRAFDEMAERVTDLRRAERELLANISHELRTPLSRIRVALDLASEGDADMARASLADIAEDLNELERLIADVLTAAKLGLEDGSAPAGIPPLRRQRVDLRDLLGHAVSRFRSAHPARELRVDMADSLPAIDGDPVLLRRVIDNLLENAHKYSERPGDPIELMARPADATDAAALSSQGEIAIDVIDKGIGIDAADLPKVFRPFFRADKSRARKTGGLGLGLALAKRIVDAHGGTIELKSALAKGTRARVRLPIADGPTSS